MEGGQHWGSEMHETYDHVLHHPEDPAIKAVVETNVGIESTICVRWVLYEICVQQRSSHVEEDCNQQ